jgi:[acyl-carrier-protein] S-malonyltransferase
MGRAWYEASPAAAAVFMHADDILGPSLGARLSTLCFDGPADELNKTNISQPAIYVCSVACYRGLEEQDKLPTNIAAVAGLSLGEYTALHLAGAFSFEDGLNLVVTRGRLMQQAAEASGDSGGGMVALIGAEAEQAEELCRRVANGQILVCANFNAPGQIVLSGHIEACQRAVEEAKTMKLVAKPLTVAGAFHSPLMQPAADEMAKALATAPVKTPNIPVYSNVTADRHPMASGNGASVELVRRRLVEQIVLPVRWAESCQRMIAAGMIHYCELAPGNVLRGLMRRIDRTAEVTSHDEPDHA